MRFKLSFGHVAKESLAGPSRAERRELENAAALGRARRRSNPTSRLARRFHFKMTLLL
jgi:hypothetical protein